MASQCDVPQYTGNDDEVTDLKTNTTVQQEVVDRQEKAPNGAVLLGKSSVDWQRGISLGENLLYLYENKMWTDVSFICEKHDVDDKQDRIKAHKIVLAARSPFFQAMFYGPFADNEQEKVLKEVDASIFDLAVKFIYSDSTDLTDSNVYDVIGLAHMYQIVGLVEYCYNYMKPRITTENACEILELALCYNIQTLADSACEVIDDNAKQVLESDNLMDTSENCLTYILKGDTFFEKETEIIKVAERWAEKQLADKSTTIDGKEKRNVLGKAFYYLRVPTLFFSEFTDNMCGKGLYTIDENDEILKHISHPEKVESVSCHSCWKRESRKQTLRLKQALSGATVKADKVQSTLLLRVTKDCILQRIQIKKMSQILQGSICIDNNCKQSFKFDSSVSEHVTIGKPIGLRARKEPYTLQLMLQQSKSTTAVSDIEVEVKQRSLTSVPSFGAPAFEEKMCKEGKHSQMCLSFFNEETGTYKSSFANSKESSHVAIINCKESSHVNIIKSIDICIVSGRDK